MSEAAPSGYAVGQFRDPAAEIDRLKLQASLLASAEDEALTALGLPSTGRVLDLGCGPGFVAARIRARRPEVAVWGVDRDRTVVKLAKARTPAVVADARHLPFPDATFDCVHARLVFRHLDQPEIALREVHRVLRRGGRAIVVDTDDGSLVLHPAPSGFGRILAARHETFRRRGADPFIGRRLACLFRAAGFRDLASRALVVDSVAVGRPVFAAVALAPIADAIDSDLLAPDEARAGAAAISDWAANEDAFGMMTAVALSGRKDNDCAE